MFKSSKPPALPPSTDFTNNLRETSFYRYGHLRPLGLTGDVTALAVDPILSLLAVGTSSGMVHVYGAPEFQFTLPVSAATGSSGGHSIRFLVFHPGHHRIIAVDDGNTLHSFSLQHLTDHPNPLTHPPLPVKEASYSIWGTITAIEQPLPSYTHLFMTMKDGTTLCWDLSRGSLGNWKVNNMWMEHEERMIRSGIPGRHKTLGGPMATCLAMNPRDLNIFLIGYEGGVVAYNVQKAMVEKTFEMTLMPGAPGGGSYQDADGSLWTERTPGVSCITWRPDGLMFAVGHSDGCIAFWAYSESDKPLMVRTVTHEDVNVTDADELFSAGALDNQLRPKDGISAVSANREPIFKLSWVGFPDRPSLQALVAAQGTGAAGEPITNATMDYAERQETLLLVLGGQSPGEKPGINILQFPAYIPPPPASAKKTPMSPSQSLPLQERYAYRDSLAPTGSSFYPTKTPPEDYVLIPRSSPYFGLAHDPIAIVVSLTPDSSLSAVNAPQALRGIESWAFPPPRSTIVPPSPGRKNYVLPGEGEKIVAMTPAPMLGSAPGTPRSASGGWRLPWTSGTPSPTLSPTPRLSTPDSMASVMGAVRPRTRARQRLRVPSSLWSGRLSVLTADVRSLPTPTFKKLISWSIENAGSEDVPRLPIVGGMAVPDLQSHGAPDVKVVKMESYRIMITSHPDASIRFWDVSPHLLLLPTPLRFEYPGPLPHLTISLGTYLSHPDLSHLPLARLWETDRSKVVIRSVHLAREALECTVTMTTGEIIVFKFAQGKKSGRGIEDDLEELDVESPSDWYFPPQGVSVPETSGDGGWVEEVLEIGHIARLKVDGFKPVAIFTPKRGEIIQCAVSDIGFIAVAFSSKSLGIIDMRGPDVILREGFDEDGGNVKKRRKKGNMQNVPGENSVVGALKWVVAGLGNDPTPRPRLIVSYAKGLTKIYTLLNALGEWIVDTKPPTFTNESLSNPIASFVLDPVSGNEMLPTAEALQSAMRIHPEDGKDGKHGKGHVEPHCLWIAVAQKSMRIAVNFNGDRVGKVELVDETLSEAFLVTRHGQKVLVGITTAGTALFYSLPFLEFITRVDLYYGHQPRPVGKISMDDRSGDFIEHAGPLNINLRTLFHFRKPYPPRLDPCAVHKAVPPQPLPVDYSTMAWLWGSGPITGAQLDALVAGPSRPPLPKAPPPPKVPLITWGKPPEEPVKAAPKPGEIKPKRTAVGKQTAPLRDAREREDAYTEMRQAAAERGNLMDNLGDQLNAVSASAGNYLSQARNAAVKEAAKGSARGLFGKLL